MTPATAPSTTVHTRVTDSGQLAAAVAVRIEQVNRHIREAAARLPFPTPHGHPVGCVQWVHIDRVRANDWNPNAVAHNEMRLLHTSIAEDGYTQPVVAIEDTDPAHSVPDPADPGNPERRLSTFVIVDGFHRYTVMRRYPDIATSTHGYLPVVALTNTSVADRMASTVRHNRARGKHSVAGMGSLVFQLLQANESDPQICAKLGLEPEELARLKHVTGYSKLFASTVDPETGETIETEYSTPQLASSQLRIKAEYARAHPEETVPNDF